jgi:hypothetical protein
MREAFIDGSFAPAKKGLKVGKTKPGKRTKIMAVADSHGPQLPCVELIAPRRCNRRNKIQDLRGM